MREIKFRAWHNEANEYCEGETSNMFGWIEDGQNVTLEQYTGLKDKNGVDIYEGDVLSLVFHYEFHNECISIEDGEHYCNVKVHWDRCGYWLFSEADATWYFPQSLDDCASFEVIGNIHQNPELVEV